MHGILSRFRDTRGSVAVAFAISVIPVTLGVGVAVDYTNAAGQQSKMQAAADAAALAGAKSLSISAAQAEQIATRYFQAAGINTSKANVTVQVDTQAHTVKVSASAQTETAFLSIAGINTIPYSVAATAIAPPTKGPVCIHELDTSANGAFVASGGSRINAAPCVVWTNSTSASSITFSGGSSSVAARHCFEGGVTQGSFLPAPEKCGHRPDPFANLNPTAPSGCSYTNFSRGGGTYVLSPGVYCGGLSLSGGPNVILLPGVYVIRDGKFNMSGGGTMTGQNVAFLLEGDAQLDLSGGGSYYLSGRTSGDLMGFVFFQRSNSNVGGKANISGSGDMYFQGILYFPSQLAEVSGGGSTQTIMSPFTAYIARVFKYTGGSEIRVDYNSTTTTVPVRSELFYSTGTPRLIN